MSATRQLKMKNYQLINEHSEGEAIDFLRVLLFPVVLDNFWSHEAFCSTEALCTCGQRGPTDAVIRQFGINGWGFRSLR